MKASLVYLSHNLKQREEERRERKEKGRGEEEKRRGEREVKETERKGERGALYSEAYLPTSRDHLM